jgi:hypothetical protein
MVFVPEVHDSNCQKKNDQNNLSVFWKSHTWNCKCRLGFIRIIESNTQRTICEHFETRQGSPCNYPHVSNKMIVEKQSISPFTSAISNPQNLNILVTRIIPAEKISNEQRVFIQAIINEITKMFVILNSVYYKKGRRCFLKIN